MDKTLYVRRSTFIDLVENDNFYMEYEIKVEHPASDLESKAKSCIFRAALFAKSLRFA
ncbi:MAG: hypothetical protein JRD93_14980 [Deltaproteobacteria bacterium]|nr:hypothetical protein [Deltaproteobacteria bacterium]MBW2740402.1 hypothetical protein [Deltaproteobacteria bacterium]